LSFESAFYPDRRALTDAERTDAARIFDAWEQALACSGGPCVAGALSLADLAFVPTVVRLLAHAPELARWPRTARWMDELLARASVREWMDEARALPPVRLDDY